MPLKTAVTVVQYYNHKMINGAIVLIARKNPFHPTEESRISPIHPNNPCVSAPPERTPFAVISPSRGTTPKNGVPIESGPYP
jgi:hypothetical protein